MKKLPCIRLFEVICLIFFAIWSGTSFADNEKIGSARLFEDSTGARLSIAPIGESADKNYLVMFENFNHEWDGKVILHHFDDSTDNKKYLIKIETGKKLRPYKTFATIVDSGKITLVNGSIVPVVDVYLPGKSGRQTLVQSRVDRETAEKMLTLFKSQKFQVTF